MTPVHWVLWRHKDKQINHEVLVYGVDGSPDMKKLLIDSDEVQGTAAQSPTMGAKAIKAAYKIVNYEQYEKSIVVPVTLITKNNISEYDISGGNNEKFRNEAYSVYS